MPGRMTMLLLLLCLCTHIFAQFNSDCADLARQTKLDKLIYDGFEKIPALTESEVRCIARYHALGDIDEGIYKLLDRESEPLFNIDGQTICELDQYDYEIFIIPDLAHNEAERSIIQLFIYHYNLVMFQVLEKNLNEVTIDQLLYAPKKLGPYLLRERLLALTYGKSLVSLEKEAGEILRVRFNVKNMFQNLDISYSDLNFIVIDENNPENRFELSAKEIMNKGFRLSTEFIRGSSEYWFDFRVRIDYNKLIENGEIHTCEKVNDYLFQFVHLTITRDFRIIPHNH